MANNKARRLVGAVIVLIGAILLIATVFMPWYTEQLKATTPVGTGTSTNNAYPATPSQSNGIQCSSSGVGSCKYGSSSSYQTDRLNNTGNIAEAGLFMLIIGFVVGLVGAILAVLWRGNPKRGTPALALAIIAMLLALLTPVLFAALLPGAQSSDYPQAERFVGSGPWSSFSGSSSGTLLTVPITFTWGPGIGWYLSFVAFVILLIGVVFLFLYRKDPASPAPVSAPAAEAAPAARS